MTWFTYSDLLGLGLAVIFLVILGVAYLIVKHKKYEK